MMPTKDRLQLTYSERADLASCRLARHLFGLMTEKESNLCVALDETDPERFMNLAESLGPEVAVLKTHVDTIENFTGKLTVELATLAREHNFLIFEDRKFSDIGKTVRNQYTKGIFHIVEWADIVNAHAVPGPGIVQGLREEVEDYDLLDQRAILLLAQMSSKGNLIDDDYTRQVVKMAIANEDFVMGFIGAGAKKVPLLAGLAPSGFIIMSPGIKIGGGVGKLGQQYTAPETLVEAGADILIVGSDIYNHDDPLEQAQQYRKVCWDAYQRRISEPKVARTKPDKKALRKSSKKATR